MRADNGASLEGARVRVLNTVTGVGLNTQVWHGRFFIQGIEVGGPYVVEVRHIGFVPQQSRPLFLTLGEPLDIQFAMKRLAIGLGAVLVSGASKPASVGSATLISDSLVHRLPTLNRNFYDFVVLAPQVSTKVGSQRSGVSAAGANFRFNNFLINGADERFVNGNVSGAASVGKSIPLDAVKEYQVLVAPYDVRYGDFAGALINTVTQSGTNQFRGSTFAYWRKDRLARGSRPASSASYERLQYGFSLGGPVVRDRVHFYLAPEIQRLTAPAPGPYVGQPPAANPRVPVSATDLARFERIMRGYGLTSGSGGPVRNETPLRILFARLDAAVPRLNSRAIGFVRYGRTQDDQFSRSARDTFSLSTYKFASVISLRLTSLQLHTDLLRTGGGHNELAVSHIADGTNVLPDVRQPLVRVAVPQMSGGLVTLNAGTAEQAQGRFSRSRSLSIKDDLSLPWGASHVLVLGAQAERFRIERGGVNSAYGSWTFSSLDALERGVADRYEVRKDFGSASAPVVGGQYAGYVGDDWRVGERVSLTLGVRADLMKIGSRAPYNARVDSLFGRRTDEMPRPRVHVSPRLGFAWDLSGTEHHQLRGGVGVFTGRPPRAWFVPAVSNYGVGIGVLRCSLLPNDARLPPPFVRDYRAAPTQCATGAALPVNPNGEVDLLDRQLRLAQALRISLAYERLLPWGLTSTSEVLVTRYLSDFMFVNLNLQGPQAADRFGRVLYGTIATNGVAEPKLRSGFSEVIDLRNTSRNYSHQLSTRIERRFARKVAATASYTYSRTRDVQSPSRVNATGISMWADARAVSGRHEDVRRGISLNDLPHRAVAALSYTAPWERASTGISLYYVGESGSPFTYLASGVARRGDLNADGSNANDPIYIPRSAAEAGEIRFSGVVDSTGADNSSATQATRVSVQQAAFERFIERSPCLREQRGRILERNSCREPWSHLAIVSVRQAIPIGARSVEAELDVFNVLNLLNRRWGRYRVADPRLLEHVGQEQAEPVFRFDATRPQWTTLETESAFQLQLAVRYRF